MAQNNQKRSRPLWLWMLTTPKGLLTAAALTFILFGASAFAPIIGLVATLNVPLVAGLALAIITPVYIVKKIPELKAVRKGTVSIESKAAVKGHAEINPFDGRSRVLAYDPASLEQLKILQDNTASSAEKNAAARALGAIEKPGNNSRLMLPQTRELLDVDFKGNVPWQWKKPFKFHRRLQWRPPAVWFRDLFGPPNQNERFDLNWNNRNLNWWNKQKKKTWDMLGDGLKYRYFKNTFPFMTAEGAAKRAFGDQATIMNGNGNTVSIEVNGRFIYIPDGKQKDVNSFEFYEKLRGSLRASRMFQAVLDPNDAFHKPVLLETKDATLTQGVFRELNDLSMAVVGYNRDDRDVIDLFDTLRAKSYGKNQLFFTLPNADRPGNYEICYVVTPGGPTGYPIGATPVLFAPEAKDNIFQQANSEDSEETYLENYQKFLQKQIENKRNQYTVKDAIGIYTHVINGIFTNDSGYTGNVCGNRAAANRLIKVYGDLHKLEQKAGSDQLIALPVALTDVNAIENEITQLQGVIKPLTPSQKVRILCRQITDLRDNAGSMPWMRRTTTDAIGAPTNLEWMNSVNPQNNARMGIVQDQALFELNRLWRGLGQAQKQGVYLDAKREFDTDETLYQAFLMATQLTAKDTPVLPNELQRRSDMVFTLREESSLPDILKQKLLGDQAASDRIRKPQLWRDHGRELQKERVRRGKHEAKQRRQDRRSSPTP